MFFTRLISGVVLLALSLFFVISGGYFIGAFTLALSLIAYYEMAKALNILQKKPLMVLGFFSVTVYYLLLMFMQGNSGMWLVMTACLTVIGFLTVYVISFPKLNVTDIQGSLLAFIYAPVMLSFLPLTRYLPEGAYIVWMIYISSWGYDTCAYCVGTLTGKTIGNHKLFPKLSPKKSLEGIIGGVIGAAIIAWLYGRFVVEPHSGLSEVSFILAGIAGVGALIAQVGDLAASAVKRDKDIKDYSNLIPGHGGVLDRFDSMIFTAPITYFLARIFLFNING
ncbi:MAG: phosphatidate cytidylyltransferase [Lachnospiraceae bacterium]|nr:phosphatidate cytidylyltransferase [Lachnospiraceae bacterium]